MLVKPSPEQQELVASLGDRAERIRNGGVDPSIDNMLTITNDGRKLALDQRLINPMLPDFPDSKVNACVQNIYQIWEETTPQLLTQIVFCDLSTPKGDGSFNVYDDIREKLVARGIPREQVAFIHEHLQMPIKKHCSPRCATDRFVSSSVLRSRWGREPRFKDSTVCHAPLGCALAAFRCGTAGRSYSASGQHQ